MSAGAAPGRWFRSTGSRVAKVAGVGVVIVLALVAILTALRTELPRSPGVMSDALGPESGELVDDYLDRAAASLDGAGGAGDAGRGAGYDDDDEDPAADPDAPRWALVTAAQAWTAAEAADIVRALPRVSGLYVQVPVDGVAMPVSGVTLAEPVAGETGRTAVFGRGLEQTAARLSPGSAAARGAPSSAVTPGLAAAPSDRAAETAALTAARVRAGEPAIIGLLVRATTEQLRAVAGRPGVRAVEALPPDAVYERFAVRPLLPQQVEAAVPLADTAPVPPA